MNREFEWTEKKGMYETSKIVISNKKYPWTIKNRRNTKKRRKQQKSKTKKSKMRRPRKKKIKRNKIKRRKHYSKCKSWIIELFFEWFLKINFQKQAKYAKLFAIFSFYGEQREAHFMGVPKTVVVLDSNSWQLLYVSTLVSCTAWIGLHDMKERNGRSCRIGSGWITWSSCVYVCHLYAEAHVYKNESM